jgi:hypothetical protein
MCFYDNAERCFERGWVVWTSDVVDMGRLFVLGRSCFAHRCPIYVQRDRA